MPDISMMTFSYQEVAEALVKANDIHEGLWGLYIEFGMGATNLSTANDQAVLAPAAVVTVQKIGLQRFPTPNNLTIDAAVINPVDKLKKIIK